jgi:hypothetical protein
MKKRSPPRILADEPSRGLHCSYSAGGGLDGVLKPFLFSCHWRPALRALHVKTGNPLLMCPFFSAVWTNTGAARP